MQTLFFLCGHLSYCDNVFTYKDTVELYHGLKFIIILGIYRLCLFCLVKFGVCFGLFGNTG